MCCPADTKAARSRACLLVSSLRSCCANFRGLYCLVGSRPYPPSWVSLVRYSSPGRVLVINPPWMSHP